MTLIVEDGTGLATTESYGSVTEADLYHSNVGNTAWTNLDDTVRKEQCLRKSFRYMNQRWRGSWKGFRSYTVQKGDWPRLGVIIDDVASYPTGGRLQSYAYMIPQNVVPDQVKEAQFELALIAIDNDLFPTLDQGQDSLKLGPLEIKFNQNTSQRPRYPHVGMILGPLLMEFANMMKIAR